MRTIQAVFKDKRVDCTVACGSSLFVGFNVGHIRKPDMIGTYDRTDTKTC